MTRAEASVQAPRYGWSYLIGVARQHRRTLVIAHVIAVAAVLAAIPIPLLMPLLVDEVLLGRPGPVVIDIKNANIVRTHSVSANTPQSYSRDANIG